MCIRDSSNGLIDFSPSGTVQTKVAASADGIDKFTGDLAHVFLDYTYRDLSVTSNRRLFIDANGGSTSPSTLSALSPVLYLPMTTDYAVGKNLGTGGDFSATGSPTIVQSGTEYVADSGKGGLVWTKSRTNNHVHILIDTVRGNEKFLYSNDSWAEASSAGYITSFNNNGYSLGSASYMNDAAQDFASWTFRKQPGFFDIVTYTGDASIKNRAIPHNLGSTPGMVIIKSTGSRNWAVWHRGFTPHWTGGTTPNDVTGGNNVATILLDTTGAGGAVGWFTYVNDTAFGVDNNSSDYNVTGENYVAYVFAHDAQDFGTDSDEAIIKCGTFTEPSSGAVSVDLGFEPQFLLVKATGVSDNWRIYDMMRGMPVTPNTKALYPNTSGAEVTYTSTAGPWPTPTATGFKWPSGQVGANEPWIYMAIRRPHKPAEEFAATDLFSATAYTGDNSSNRIIGSLPAGDLAYTYTRNYGSYAYLPAFWNRLTGGNALRPDRTNAMAAQATTLGWDNQIGQKISVGSTNINHTSGTFALYNWRRAPGFFDVVTYKWTGGSTTINHNLGVPPELIITKEYGHSWDWYSWGSVLGANKVIVLNNSDAVVNYTFNTTVTDTTFNAGIATTNQPAVAYLFASVDGISKVGTYTGTGNDLNVDCGFSAGARFILIKRTDSTGDWYLWDSASGIVAGEEPYVLINTAGSEQTATDYVDPLSSGFTVTSSAPAALNASGGTYLFYAIA